MLVLLSSPLLSTPLLSTPLHSTPLLSTSLLSYAPEEVFGQQLGVKRNIWSEPQPHTVQCVKETYDIWGQDRAG